MATFRALKPWQVHYPDPIRGQAGDRLTLGRPDEEYPGWVWATAPDGRSGWVPESWLRVDGDSGVLLHAYTAAELPLAPGDVVNGELVLNGWLWATNAAGNQGWVPIACLGNGDQADGSPP
jgi:hypothetical protein